MSMDNEMQVFYRILQKFRRINWGSELTAMTQAEFVAITTIRSLHAAHPDKPGVYVSALAERCV